MLCDEGGDFVYRVASKSGALLGVQHDDGLIWTPQPLVIALMSEGGLDRRSHPDNPEVRAPAGGSGLPPDPDVWHLAA